MNRVNTQALDNDNKKLILRFLKKHPQAAARILEQQPSEQVTDFLQTIDPTRTQQVTAVMLPHYVARLCQLAPVELAAQWLEPLSTRRQSMILRYLNKSQRNAVLQAFPTKMAMACRVLLKYPDDSVGAWMSDQFMVLPDNIDVAEALQRLQGPNAPFDNDAIPVVDAEHYLSGTVSYQALASAARSAALIDIIQRDFPTLSSRLLLAKAQTHTGWSQYDTLPVLNRERQLVGMLRHVHLRDGLENLTHPISEEPIAPNDMIASVSQVYLDVLGASFGWISELLAPRTEHRPVQDIRRKL